MLLRVSLLALCALCANLSQGAPTTGDVDYMVSNYVFVSHLHVKQLTFARLVNFFIITSYIIPVIIDYVF